MHFSTVPLILIIIGGILGIVAVVLIICIVIYGEKSISQNDITANKDLSEGYFIQMLSNNNSKAFQTQGINLYDGCSGRGTCGAYTFINHQTLPMVFLQSDFDPAGVGIMYNKNFWQLITNFSIVDGDTYSRTICSNDTGWNYGTVQNYPSKCASDDTNCRILNSGGSPSWHSPPCNGTQGDQTTCDKSCFVPQLCTDAGQQNLFSTYKDISNDQCKYTPSMFQQWVEDLHWFYNQLLQQKFIGSTPYYENEFNVYIYPDFEDPIYKAQNKIFQDSIVAVIYSPLSWTDIGGKSGEGSSYDPLNSAKTLADSISKQLGRQIPVLAANVLPSNVFKQGVSDDAKTALNKAIAGNFSWSDVFSDPV